MWSFSSWMSCCIICSSFVNDSLIFWAASNTLMRREEVGRVRESTYFFMLVALFYRMVGRWVYTNKLSKLIRWNQHSPAHRWTETLKSGPNLQNSEHPAHQFRWTGIPTELRVRFGVKHNILYRQYLVRNLLCSTGNTLSLVEQDAVPQVGTGPPTIHSYHEL
jgi:hypothetical protein